MITPLVQMFAALIKILSIWVTLNLSFFLKWHPKNIKSISNVQCPFSLSISLTHSRMHAVDLNKFSTLFHWFIFSHGNRRSCTQIYFMLAWIFGCSLILAKSDIIRAYIFRVNLNFVIWNYCKNPHRTNKFRTCQFFS